MSSSFCCLGVELVTVTATDADGRDNRITYSLLDPSLNFTINENGFITHTEPFTGDVSEI